MLDITKDEKCLQDAIGAPTSGEVAGHCSLTTEFKACNIEQCPYWHQGAGRFCSVCDLDTGGGTAPQVEDDPRQTTINWDE